ncbi:MAG: M67 family metallopeptidase [Mariprofundaceae bacterium]
MDEPARFKSPEYLNILDHTASENTCHFSSSAIQTMTKTAEEGYPLEVCGLLIGNSNPNRHDVIEARQVTNLNTDRAADRFQLDPAAYQAIDRELRSTKYEIIGVYHSHPDCPAKPSPTDLESAWEGFAYPIISVHEGQVKELRCWQLNDTGEKFQCVTTHEK